MDYGEAVRAFEVDVLTEKEYVEHEMKESPVAKATGKGWNAEGMHCLDAWWNGTEWIACVDGRYNNRWSIGMLKSVKYTK